jgi:hypothetical protein
MISYKEYSEKIGEINAKKNSVLSTEREDVTLAFNAYSNGRITLTELRNLIDFECRNTDYQMDKLNKEIDEIEDWA